MYISFLIFLLLLSPGRPTAANNGQRRPTQAHKGPQQLTTANEGQRRPRKAHSSQRRPTQAHEGPQQLTMANEGQRRPRKAHSSQRRPTKAHKDEKGPERRIGGVFFLMYILFLIFLLLLSPGRPTAANDGQQRPTQAHKGPQQLTTANEGQRRPRKARSSQRRPTKAHKDEKGPMTWTGEMGRVMAGARDASPRYVLIFFFCFIIIIIDVFLGVAYFAPGTGRKRPQNGPKRRVWRRLGLRYLFVNIFPAFSKLTKIFMLSSFYLCFYSCITSTTRAWRGNKEKNGPKRCEMHRLGHCGAYWPTKAHIRQRRPTQAHESPRQPATANDGQ
jgi:hypothetical protein